MYLYILFLKKKKICRIIISFVIAKGELPYAWKKLSTPLVEQPILEMLTMRLHFKTNCRRTIST